MTDFFSTDMSSSTEFITSTESYDGHKLPCTSKEVQDTACLQGKCFAVDLNPRVAACECISGWTGIRCEIKELPPDLWDASSVAGLVIGLVLLIVVIAAALVGWFLWKRHKSSRYNGNRDVPRNSDHLLE